LGWPKRGNDEITDVSSWGDTLVRPAPHSVNNISKKPDGTDDDTQNIASLLHLVKVPVGFYKYVRTGRGQHQPAGP
jgi:hypothetical protein